MQKNSINSNCRWSRLITLKKCIILIFILLANHIAEELITTALASGRGKPSRMSDTLKKVAGSSQNKRLSTDSKQEGKKTEHLSGGASKSRMPDTFKNLAGSSPRKRLNSDSGQDEHKSELLTGGPGKSRMPDNTKNVAGSSTSKRLLLDSKQKDDSTSNELSGFAQEVLSKMNEDEKPCNDFYKFACGICGDKRKIPNDGVCVNEVSKIAVQVRNQLQAIILEERSSTDPKYLKFPNFLYKACMNEKSIETLSTKQIKQIAESLGGWPVVVGDSWDKHNAWTWQETVKKFRRFGLDTNILLTLFVTVDYNHNTKYKHIITLDQMPSEWSTFQINSNHMFDIAVLMGAKQEAAKNELSKSLEFETKLREIAVPKKDRRNLNDFYNLRTIKELQQSYPYVQWLDYINSLLPEDTTIKVDENEAINVVVPNYFDKLGEILGNTDKRVIANYVMWRMHQEVVFSLPQEFRNRKFEHDSDLSGKKSPSDRQIDCINFVASRLSLAMGSLYVRKYFQSESQADVLKMAKTIHKTFSNTFDDAQWMDQNTKQEAKKKLDAMKITVGYTEELLDNTRLEEYYRKLEIDPDKLVQSMLNMNVFFADKHFNQLRLPLETSDWTTLAPPHIVNARYKHTQNRIEIPAAILQGTFYNAQRPKYMNYGAIGSFIGHEITHAFDDKGRRFGPDGKLVNWWDPNTEKAFLEKTQCFIKQYSEFKEEQTGLNIDGDRTQGENIADNGGFKQSYLAYNQWVVDNSVELPLPGLEKYTPKQLFWISAAQALCVTYRKEQIENLIKNSEHIPPEFRITGAFRNIESFSTDFHCEPDSPMNPSHKCIVW